MKQYSAFALGLVLLASTLFAADWSQWQGPERNSISKETGLLKTWPKGGPPLVWTFKDAGVGYSAPAIVGETLYTMGARDDVTYLFALGVKDGKEIWKTKIGPSFTFKGNQWGAGPRATPTIHEGLVYALGGGGELVCAQASDGKEVWRKHMQNDLKGEVNPEGGGPEKIGWGYSWSPLVDGDKLICVPGGPQGAVAALDRKTGSVLWRTKELKEQASYASPIVAEVAGVRQYIILHYTGLAGVAAKDGALLWAYKKSPKYSDVVIPTPIYHEGHVYVSAGFRPATCDLVKLTVENGKFTAEKVYGNRVMKNLVGGSVLVDKHLYGYSDRVGWVCQEFKTGKEVWSDRRVLGPGSLMYADGHLYCYSENDGIVALVEASTAEWKEKGRFEIPEKTKMKAPSGKNWTPPVIANGRLYIRDQELLFCYNIK